MARLKVWGGLVMRPGSQRQVRVVIAATSQKEAARLVCVKLHELRRYWSETGNPGQIKAAMSMPGVPFAASESMKDDYTRATWLEERAALWASRS